MTITHERRYGVEALFVNADTPPTALAAFDRDARRPGMIPNEGIWAVKRPDAALQWVSVLDFALEYTPVPVERHIEDAARALSAATLISLDDARAIVAKAVAEFGLTEPAAL